MKTVGDPQVQPGPGAPVAAVPETGHWGWLLGAVGLGLFVGAAVVLEVLSGSNANSPVPGFAEFAPLAWPQWARVAWWIAVAGAAGGFRWCMHRYGMRQRFTVVVLSVAPFVLFALGIATSADWATWH